MKILLLSNGNIALGKMARGVLSTFDQNAIIRSADVSADGAAVSRHAVDAMLGKGVDISKYIVYDISDCLKESWGAVVVIGDDLDCYREQFVDGVRNWIELCVDGFVAREDTKDEYVRVYDEMHHVLKHLYFDKIRNVGGACSCGANDFCICH